MIKPQVNSNRVVFGPCRLSYTHVFRKHNPNGSENDPDAKYQTNVLIPKDEKETIKAIQAAIENAKIIGQTSKWGGKLPKKLDEPLHDGAEREDELYESHLYLNAKAKTRPGIVDRKMQPIIDEDEMYSGVWAVVSVTFFPYDSNGNRGVACGLNNLMKFKDDEMLGGRTSPENDFSGVNLGDDDEEDL